MSALGELAVGMGQLVFEFLACIHLFGKPGPLQVCAEMHGDKMQLTLENKGRVRVRFAAVELRDSSGFSHYPATDMVVRTPLNPGRKQTLILDIAELREKNCQSLAVLDSKGNAWPVEGFNFSRLH